MAKPTDELPDVSPKKEPDPSSVTETEPKSTENSEHSLEKTSEIPEQSFETPELSDSEQDVDLSEIDAPSSENDLSSNPEAQIASEFLTSDGQDPSAIAMHIDQGGSADTIDLLDEDNILQQVAGVFLLWWHWAYFEITVTSPNLPVYNPPKIVHPELIAGNDEYEFVYDICDQGYKLSTSKGEDMYSVGMSMCKMFYTIEKMIYILVKRIKDEGINTETEVQVTFDGHLLAQRKAFESIINLNYNVVVTNFDPGLWGERYLEIVKRLSDKGYGYPSEAPREIYKIIKRSITPSKP